LVTRFKSRFEVFVGDTPSVTEGPGKGRWACFDAEPLTQIIISIILVGASRAWSDAVQTVWRDPSEIFAEFSTVLDQRTKKSSQNLTARRTVAAYS
jgi:hypothetical protein